MKVKHNKSSQKFPFGAWGAGYFLMQLHVNRVFRLHFHKLVFTGKENIPQDKPLIYAPTHRNALMDALILVHENVKQQVVFLARADIFKKPLVIKILYLFKIMPVYRIRDGKENLGKNKEIFVQCGEILKNGNPLCLFPEARFNPHQNLLPLQKAIPRIALPTEAETGFTLDTHIVPVAFYYTAKDRFLSDLYVTYGKPVRVADYKELYLTDENQAINKLRNDLDDRLRQYVVDIPEEDYGEISALIDVNANDLAGKSYPEKDGIVKASQEIIRRIKALKESNPQAYTDKITAVQNALQLLKSHGLTSKDPITRPKGYLGIFARALPMVATAPLALAGLLNTIFPILIYKKLLSVVKDKQFISSIRLVTGIFAVPIFYLLQFALVGLIGGSWLWALTYLLASPVVFYFGCYWRKGWKEIMRMEEVRQFVKEKKDVWEKVLNAFEV